MKLLYPEIEPYNEFNLKVSNLHTIHVEESGNKNGKPVKIPKLVVKSKEDKKIFEQGKLRMERRIKERRT